MGNTFFIVPIVSGTEILMSTDLNSLANNTVKVGSVIIDNTSNRYLYVEFELVIASVDLSAQVNPAVELYLIPSYDGINYADTGIDGSTTILPPNQYLVAVMGVVITNAAHRAISPHIMLDPIKYTPVVINKTGVALAAANNTLKFKIYTTITI